MSEQPTAAVQRAPASSSAPSPASKPLQAVRGMNDVLPDEARRWEFLEAAVRETFRQYGYRRIRTPIVVYTELFLRGVGETT